MKIDREKRLMLLRWLKQGEIDPTELRELKESLPPLSLEDIEAELQKSFGRGKSMAVCQCFKRLGICEKGGSK
jgi:hypothetical protein